MHVDGDLTDAGDSELGGSGVHGALLLIN